MASLIPGYEYDIFISYRQKDNRHDSWVTEFVENLKGELESTFKEEVSVYFDINPHDGILETYNVDASLRDKLKCLVFIPVISRTYCDLKSFAWANELCAFNRFTKEDPFGRDIRLANGNIASRILPVRIHDLDSEDKILLENELGGTLRSVDFIYKSSGINRPLKSNDERTENINHTYYPDQINKVANAVKEIITALQKSNLQDYEPKEKGFKSGSQNLKKSKKKGIILILTIALILIVSGYLFSTGFFQTIIPAEKSIAVLPFENMSNDPEQEYFSDGMMQEIMNHLFMIGGLDIPSSTSSMRFKGSKLSIREIARKLDVSYVLEGNVSRSGDNVRIIVRLVNGKNGQLLWTEDYIRAMTATDLHDIQSDVAQQVAQNMKIEINPVVIKRIETKPTKNTEAYSLFLRATQESSMPLSEIELLLQKAVELDPEFGDAQALLAYYYLWSLWEQDSLTREQLLTKVEPLIEKALKTDPSSIYAHGAYAELRLFFYWDLATVEKEYQIVSELSPSNPAAYSMFYNYLIYSGRSREAVNMVIKDFRKDDFTSEKWRLMALAYNDDGNHEKALEIIKTAMQLFPNNKYILRSALGIFIDSHKYKEALVIFDPKGKSLHDLDTEYLASLGIAYYKTGNLDKSDSILNELLSRSRKSHLKNNYYCLAGLYMAMNDENNALSSLENAYSSHETLMVSLKVDHNFLPLHGNPRFENLLMKVGITPD